MVSGDIVDAAYKVHTTLGPGLLESVYEAVLAHELVTRGHRVERQVPIGSQPEPSAPSSWITPTRGFNSSAAGSEWVTA